MLIVAAIALAANHILMPDTDFSADTEKGCEEPDYFFLGTSNVFYAVNPVVIWDEEGLVGYDVSSEKAPLIMSYYYLKDALKQHKPQYVFLDCAGFRYNYGEAAMNQLSIDKLPWNHDKVALIGNIGQEEGEKEYPKSNYVFPLLKFHSRWKDLIMDGRDTYHDPYEVSFMGYVPTKKVFTYKKQYDWLPSDEVLGQGDRTEVTRVTEKWFRKILGLCESNGVTLILIKNPTKYWSLELHDAMIKLARENDLTFIDLNEERYIKDIGIDESTDFCDEYSHFNITGSEKISRWLARFMKKNLKTEDKRENPYYASIWNEKYQDYLEYKEK